ncbi:RNA 2'-phosphotransferase [Glycomyces harbinensis]|uniref:Probable RNA 2'-phosphotransferase n=1 Tax=Glycomyces harbinensis TaxID=58114 RepID=A0A1G6X977_9ACTN|nr:RNA 2'-phosphotransferase [Glycomyces harbinensis]SDD74760.1 putative RNA 2'-phosphotransferase [Glycomyces harbinensis]
MDDKRIVKVSKYLSRHLRHDPGRIGITLDEQGWVDVDVLLKALEDRNFRVSREELQEVVDRNDKQRFALRDGRIRASQGHTIDVDLGLEAVEPPAVLFHGTTAGYVEAIREEGIKAMDRHDVHLSPDRETAVRVGSRRGKPVVLVVDAYRMSQAGHEFRRSENGVWLTGHVPAWAVMFPG